MTTPPEIEKLREQAWDRKPLSKADEHVLAVDPDRFTYVSIRDAEAAVLACEQRIREERYEADVIGPARAFARDYRQRTVAEIVEALRLKTAEFAFAEGDYAEGQEVGWIDAADYVEQRFGAKETGDGNG